MVEAHVKTLTSSHELPRKKACTLSMHKRSLHTMGPCGTKHKIQEETRLKGKLCFILHYFLFLQSDFDFSVTLSVSPKPKVLILCFTYFTNDFSMCTNCACLQVTEIRILEDLMLTKLYTIHDNDSAI